MNYIILRTTNEVFEAPTTRVVTVLVEVANSTISEHLSANITSNLTLGNNEDTFVTSFQPSRTYLCCVRCIIILGYYCITFV